MSYRAVKASTRIDEDANEELIKLAQSSGYTKQFIASHAIMQVEPMGMLDPDWAEKIKKLEAVRVTNKYDFLDDPCVALNHIDDHWECTWGRVGNTPNTKKLGVSEEAVKVRCGSCQKTIAMAERLVTAEEKLAKGIVHHLPSCKWGGQLSKNGKKLFCKNPKMRDEYRDVNKWCKVVRNKANCEYLTWTIIKIQGKAFELDKNSV